MLKKLMTTSKFKFVGDIFLLLLVLFLICGCSRWIGFKTEFLAFPSEITHSTNDNDLTREALFDLDYSIVIVTKKSSVISPVKHYRHEHTFTNKVWVTNVTFQNPQLISSFIIIDELSTNNGIAIKKNSDDKWKVLWLTNESITEIKTTKRIKLKPYNEMPNLK